MSSPSTGNIGTKIKNAYTALIDWTWARHGAEEKYWHYGLRALVRVFIILVREFQQDRITLRASALTFTVVLSIVPVLALGTSVLKGLGAGDQMRQAAYHFIEQLDGGEKKELSSDVLPEAEKTRENAVQEQRAPTAEEPPAMEPTTTGSRADENLSSHLRTAVDKIFDYVERTNFATLGAFGIVGLLFAVISVLGSIEQSMNAIWQTGGSRPIGRKILDYMALMILLPISINLALAVETMLQSQAILDRLRIILPIALLESFLLTILPILLVVATFTILYRFLPNTNVRVVPALAGGAFGGVGWFITQSLYIKLQIGVAKYNAIYGSFATLPLFLVWVYVAWVVFLAGAEMAFAVQNWQHYTPVKGPVSPIARLALAFNIVSTVQTGYKHGKVTYCSTLVNQLSLPENAVNDVLEDLLQGGILRKVEGNGREDGYVPGAPAEKLNPAEIVELIFGTDVPPLRGSSLAIEALRAARLAVAEKNISPTG